MTPGEVKLICDACTETESPHYVEDRDANCERLARALAAALDECDELQHQDQYGPVMRLEYARGFRAAIKAVRVAICNAMSDAGRSENDE